MAKKTAAEMVIEADAEVPPLSMGAAYWMPTPGARGGTVPDVVRDSRVVEIVKTLGDTPLMIDAVLQFVRRKNAELASAQLAVLYTPDQLEQMKKEAGLA